MENQALIGIKDLLFYSSYQFIGQFIRQLIGQVTRELIGQLCEEFSCYSITDDSWNDANVNITSTLKADQD